MFMNGQEITTIEGFYRNFAIDELVYSYYSGELYHFLINAGEREKAARIGGLANNAYLLIELYKTFSIPPDADE